MALNITMCGNCPNFYHMSEESESYAEELLKLLPSTPHADEARGHWEMMLHCEIAAFSKPTPNLPLPSREARFYWYLYSAAAKHLHLYQKDVNHAVFVTLAKVNHFQIKKKNIKLSDQLLRLKTLDRISRKNVINQLERFICKQTTLESICLEGLSLTPTELVQLASALHDSRKTMKYMYCWRAFEKMKNPFEKVNMCDWFHEIGHLEFLTTLSVNYADIATSTGIHLINLSKRLGKNWQWLQLLCIEEEIMRNVDYERDCGYGMIPDIAWKKARFWAPSLKVQYAIIDIPKYDVHKKFLTKSTPVHTFVVTTNIDLQFRQPWYIDCTVRTICLWYPKTLVYLCLRTWHNREYLDNYLRKLFLDLPLLEVFEFLGEIRTMKTLCAMCCQIRSGKCKVRRVLMQLQEVIHADIDKDKWLASIQCLLTCFKQDFKKLGVKFEVCFYSC